MDILYYLATLSLVLFMLLATYDGFVLHIWKYRLFDRAESLFEHKVHTVRAILFPLIVWSLCINTSSALFILGIALVFLDIAVLGIDAYHEKESRSFMGGLPKWEYIVHLFANAFHFAAILLVVALRVEINDGNLAFVATLPASLAGTIFQWVAENVLPGAVLLALLHLILIRDKPKALWLEYRNKIPCC